MALYTTVNTLHNLFYVTSDTYQWRRVVWQFYHYDYLDEHKPASGNIPELPQIQAAVHPTVVDWSNQLFRYCNDKPEQPVLKDALGIVFLHVLLIDKSKRIGASSLSELLAHVRNRWRKIEEGPVQNPDPQSPVVQHPDASGGLAKSPVGPSPTPGLSQDALCHSKLCSAIMQIGSDSPLKQPGLWKDIQDELTRDPSQVGKPCPLLNCYSHPIHIAIRNKSYEALKELLIIANIDDLNIRCSGCGDRTALEEACQEPGDVRALNYFKPHKSKLEVTRQFYNDHKKKMTRFAGNALKELCPDSVQQDIEGGPLWRIRTNRSGNSSGS